MRKIPAPYTDPTPLFRHGGAPLEDRGKILDFSASINPLGPPRSVLEALRGHLDTIDRYPDPAGAPLAGVLAIASHGTEPHEGCAVVGNGSNELIYAIARALQPRRVAIVEPTYTEYLRASLLAGSAIDHWLAEGPEYAVEPFDPQGADLVWLCNPNNPTGRCWGKRESLYSWFEAFPQTMFVVDEAFMPFCTADHDSRGLCLVGRAARITNFMVLHSFTKTFALPGLRLGYCLARPELARRIQEQIPPWSVNTLAQVAGMAAWNDVDFLERTRAWCFSAERHALLEQLAHISKKLSVIRTEANFVLLRLDGIPSSSLVRRLAERGVLVRDAANFVGMDSSTIRVAIRTAVENQRLLNELHALFQE
jgi:threonine-phosphate decarboxylase